MPTNLPRITRDVTSLLHQGLEAAKEGDVAAAKLFADALRDARFLRAARRIENVLQATGEGR